MKMFIVPIVFILLIYYAFRKGYIRKLFSLALTVIILGITFVCFKVYTNAIINNHNEIFSTALDYYSKETVKQAENLYRTRRIITFNEDSSSFILNINGKWYPLSEIQYKKEGKRTYVKVDDKSYIVTDKDLTRFLEGVH